MASFNLVKEIPAAVRAGAGRTADDIQEMADALRKHPSQTLCVEGVWNPGRFYDGLRKLGFTVKVRATGRTESVTRLVKGESVTADRPLYDVYASVPVISEGPQGS